MPKPAIKICGLKDPVMAREAVRLGADYIGIICYLKSKRFVSVDQAADIAAAVREAGGVPVVVCVDQDAEQMLLLCDQIGVSMVQCAGDNSRQSHALLPSHIKRVYVLPVTPEGKVLSDNNGLDYLDRSRDFIMFDGINSGSGEAFNWAQFQNSHPFRFFLAGGLDAENVIEAIEATQADVVDVSSGVESEPGVKDINKIKKFIETVRGVYDE